MRVFISFISLKTAIEEIDYANVVLEDVERIDCAEDIETIVNEIKTQLDLYKVILINWKVLKKSN